MDGRIVKEDAIGNGGRSVALATTEASAEGTGIAASNTLNSSCPGGVDDSLWRSGGREWEELNSLGPDKARRGTSLGGDLGG